MVVAAGALTISTPASASFGTVSVGGTSAAISLGTTTVSDSRGTLVGWTVTALTDANLHDAGSAHTIDLTAASGIAWSTGSISTVSGSPTGVASGAGGFLNESAPITVATASALNGAGTYTFNPSMTLSIPLTAFPASYTAVLTQTAS